VLVARSHRSDSGIVADVSVRALAAELGVAKDTAARALATLRAKGVIALHQSRTPLGRYAAGSYMIAALDASGIAPRAVSPSSKSRASKFSTQLSLLDAD
jgi:predicted ArsR family transcriptional regulator